MAITSQYITDAEFERILADLNVDSKEDDEKLDLITRAVGDMEGDLVMRFVVPLFGYDGGDYSTVPQYTRAKVLNALRAKIRALIGFDNNRNLVIDSTQRYINTHEVEYQSCIKALLDPKRDFKLRLQDLAEDAVMPKQKVGIARADNEMTIEDDPWVP